MQKQKKKKMATMKASKQVIKEKYTSMSPSMSYPHRKPRTIQKKHPQQIVQSAIKNHDEHAFSVVFLFSSENVSQIWLKLID